MVEPMPVSTAGSPFVLTLAEAADRLGGFETLTAGGLEITVAWPDSFASKPKLRYPLVVLVGAEAIRGSATEMARLMATTGEIREAILAFVPAPADGTAATLGTFIRDQLAPGIRARGRMDDGPVLVFSPAIPIESGPDLAVLAADRDPARLVPSLDDGLRARLGTGKAYGREVVPFRRRPLMALVVALRPLLGRRARSRPGPKGDRTRFTVRSAAMDRDFEVFALLPRDAGANPDRRFPALVVLDALIELSVVAETVDRLSAAGSIPPMAVIGIGNPRREGIQAAGIRRFEEFAPPTDGYAFDDDLGRIFRALFAVFGLEARGRVDQAPALHRFIVDELLPRLAGELPIDRADLGLLGHSAGGTFVLYALHAGSPFRRFLALSPGIGVSGSWLLRTVDTRPALSRPREAFLSLGTEERTNAFNVIAGIPDTERYAVRLGARGDVTVTTAVLDGETHSSVFPPAVAKGLLAIYGSDGAGKGPA